MNKIVLTVISLVIAFSAESWARNPNDTQGKTSFNWLKLSPDAAISSSGETISARDGIEGIMVHPAAVAGIENPVAKMSYVAHYEDSQYGYVGYAGRYRGRDVGLKISYVNAGEFIRTDLTGNPIGTFSAGDMGFTLNVGNQVRDDLKIGASFSLLRSEIEDFTAVAATVDLGMIYYPPFNGLAVGAVLANVGKVLKGYSEEYQETLPVVLSVGARKKLDHAPLTLFGDVFFPNDDDINYAVGLQGDINETFSVYTGLRSRSNIDILTGKAHTDYSGLSTFGFRITRDRFRFNYAYGSSDNLEPTHKVTLALSFH